MKQFLDTGSPLLNLLNGFSDSLKMIPPDELLDEASRKRIKAEGLAILKSAAKEAERRKALAKAKSDQEEDRPSYRPRS